jgi:hypothetical protein
MGGSTYPHGKVFMGYSTHPQVIPHNNERSTVKA